MYQRNRRFRFLRLKIDPVLGSENDSLFTTMPTVTWSAAVPPVPCGFRATIAAGGSIPGMHTHGELATGHEYLHAKPGSPATRLTAPMKPPGLVFRLQIC